MTALPPELRDHLALALVAGLGPRLTRAVLDHFGSPAAVLQASAAQLEAVPLIGPTLAVRFAEAFRTIDPSREWAAMVAHGVRATVCGTAEYPARLSAIPDPPPLLYQKGELVAADTRAVGIVGSRSCTSYGKRIAERLAGGLAAAGWTVVSGLARGIDGVAHEAALAAGGRTIAVLAGGLGSIYPPEHKDLAERVALQGALITETPMTFKEIQPGMFPARNRIISGLSRGIIVVEANAKSGALITATHAAEQGREVFAVPGNVDSPASAGCLELIRKGVRLVRSVDDVLEDFQGIAVPDPPSPSRKASTPTPALFDAPPPPSLDPVQRRIWDALESPRHADELARELSIPAGELAGLLMKLEMKKVLRRLPGNQFERR